MESSHEETENKQIEIEEDLQDSEFEKELNLKEESFDLVPKELEKHQIYVHVLKNLLPYIESDDTKIVLTEVMIALKLEGLIGKQFSPKENRLLHIIKDSILQEPLKKEQALSFAKRLLHESKHNPSDGNQSLLT